MVKIEKYNLRELALLCHNRALQAGWYVNPDGTSKELNKGERMMLMVSEISEAMEGVRKNLMDDHLPHMTMESVEMADLLIRVFDYCGWREIDILRAVEEKLEYNYYRSDHKPENRNTENGKQF